LEPPRWFVVTGPLGKKIGENAVGGKLEGANQGKDRRQRSSESPDRAGLWGGSAVNIANGRRINRLINKEGKNGKKES